MNYLIVDDEPQARKLLQAYMAGLTNFKLIKSCANAMEAYEALHTQPVDLMFLDIKMPIVSGLDFLRSLKTPPLVILTTAYPKYALDGYELAVVDYLLKPIALPRLLQALEKAQSRLTPGQAAVPTAIPDFIFIKQEHKLVKVALADILLVESMQNFVKLHLKEKILIVSYTLRAFGELLPAAQFLRVHRSWMVPIAAINAINGNSVETDYQAVPIGASYRSEVLARLQKQ